MEEGGVGRMEDALRGSPTPGWPKSKAKLELEADAEVS